MFLSEMKSILGDITASSKEDLVAKAISEEFRYYYLTEETKEHILSFFYFILHTEKQKEYVPYNILLTSHNREHMLEFSDCLQKVAQKVLGKVKKIGHMTETEFLSSESLPKETKLLFIDGFSLSASEAWKLKAEELSKRPEMICIVMASYEDAQACRESNMHLFYRILSDHFSIFDYNEKDICFRILQELKVEAYKVSDAFVEGIGQYVETVYPKADLKGMEFIRDLQRRIKQLYFSKKIPDKTIGEECIPFYRKKTEVKITEPSATDVTNEAETPLVEEHESKQNAEQMSTPANTQEDTPANTSKIETDEQASPMESIVLEPIEYYTLSDENSMDSPAILNEKPENGRERNVLVLALSKFAKSGYRKANQFVCKDGNFIVNGVYQMDPVLNMLKKQGKKFDCIVLLATKETIEDSDVVFAADSEEKLYHTSPITYFLTEHRDIVEKEFEDHSQFAVAVTDAVHHAEALGKIVGFFRKMSSQSKVKLYLDTHGGFRALQVYEEAILSLLRYENIELEAAYEVQYGGENELSTIGNDETMKIFNFVSAMNEFLNCGRMESIEAYFSEESMKENQELISAIRQISEGLQSGNMGWFTKGLEKLKKFRSEKKQPKDPYLKLFEQQIFEDYGRMLSNESDDREIIKWCINKGLIQQALTLVESRHPDIMLKKKLITVTPNGYDYIAKKKQEQSFKYYSKADLVRDTFKGDLFDSIIKKDNFSERFNEINEFTDISKDIVACLEEKLNTSELTSLVKKAENIIGDRKKGDILAEGAVKYATTDAELLCEMIWMYKVLRACRNEANHSKEDSSYGIRSIKKALQYYLWLMDKILEKQKKQEELGGKRRN